MQQPRSNYRLSAAWIKTMIYGMWSLFIYWFSHPWSSPSFPSIVNLINPILERVVIVLCVRLYFDINLVGSIQLFLHDDYILFSWKIVRFDFEGDYGDYRQLETRWRF